MCNNLIRDCDFNTNYLIHREDNPVCVERRGKEVCICNNNEAFCMLPYGLFLLLTSNLKSLK